MMERKYDEHEIAQSSARAKLAFIVERLHFLRYKDKSGKHQRAAADLFKTACAGRKLTPKQMAYIDGIYEKVMAAQGFESVPLHVDIHRKARKLRYGY
jgi:hypothetical protein